MLQNVTSKSAFRLPSLFLRPAYFPISSRSQGGRGGGGSCSPDPLIFLDFIPCSPLIKPLVPKNVFSSCSLYPENFCAVPLIPKNVYHCSPYLFARFTFLFIVKKIALSSDKFSPGSKLHLSVGFSCPLWYIAPVTGTIL